MIVNLPNGTGGLANIDVLQYSAHLGHNDLLRPHVLAEVAQARMGPLKELRGLEGEMKVLNVVLGALKRRKEALEALLWTYDTILAPIRRLPDDTLMEIFCHCLPAARNARPFVSEAPLLLTLVCKKWRTVAVAAPRLWSTLHIPTVFNHHPAYAHPYDSELGLVRLNHRYHTFPDSALIPPPPDRLLELQMVRTSGLDQWLRRSGAYPLSISLHHTNQKLTRLNVHSKTGSGLQDQTALDLIARYADRLSTLEVMGSLNLLEELGCAIMLHFDFITLPRLRQLRVSIKRDRQTTLVSQASNLLSMFFSAKPLQQLVVTGFPHSFHGGKTGTDILHPVSSTITILSIHTFSDASRAHSVLSKLHKLEQCHIGIAYPGDWHLPAGQAGSNSNTRDKSVHSTIYLPILNTLSIRGPLQAIQDLCEPFEIQSLLTLHLRISPDILVGYRDRPPAGAQTWIFSGPNTYSGQTNCSHVWLTFTIFVFLGPVLHHFS